MSKEEIIKCECEKNHIHFQKRFNEVARKAPETLPYTICKSAMYQIAGQINEQVEQIQKIQHLGDSLSDLQIKMNENVDSELQDIGFEVVEVENLLEELKDRLAGARSSLTTANIMGGAK